VTLQMRSVRTPSMVVAEFRLPSRFKIPTHDHVPPHIAVVLDGALREGEDVIHAGGLRYSPANDVHHVETLDDGAHVIVLEAFGFPQLQLNRRVFVAPERARVLVEHLRDQLFASPFSSPASVEESALALFTMMRKSARRNETDTPEWLERVRARIAGTDGAHDSLDDLATLAGCHRTFVARSFRAWFGVSIGEYRRRCRLQATWELLGDARLPLGAVATQSGFADQSHMTRVFRRDVGESPAAVRARISGGAVAWFATHQLIAP
jgi:AraC family transcriptional regulator